VTGTVVAATTALVHSHVEEPPSRDVKEPRYADD
jgi:hypothetical protein